MLVGLLVKLVQQRKERVRIVGCGLPTVAASVACASIPASSISGVRAP